MALDLQAVYEARRRLRDRVRRTPLVRSDWLSRMTRAEVWLKLETLQVSHAFKVRGAFNAVAHMMEERRRTSAGEPPAAVVTASAGNHGLALAWAAREAGLSATVFTPRDAARTKLGAIASMGADLRPVARNYDEAERMALEWAAEQHATFVSPYNHPDVIAGGGTVALEIIEDLPRFDRVFVPVGGGGLVSGTAIVLAAAAPAVRIVGVEAALNPVFGVALEHGRVTTIPVHATLADGLGGNVAPDTLTFPLIRDHHVEMTAVTDQEMAEGIRRLLEYERVVTEGAGVAGVSAAMSREIIRPGERVVVVVTGGNIDFGRLRDIVAAG